MTNSKEWKLKHADANHLRGILCIYKGNIQIDFDTSRGKMAIKWTEGLLARHLPWLLTKKARNARQRNKTYELKQISSEDATIDRDILLREYETAHELGKHWDLLRWSVSKFFLGIQTVFLGAAGHVLTVSPKPPDTFIASLLLDCCGYFQIILCLIWCRSVPG